MDKKTKAWSELEAVHLKQNPAADKWSALECLDHLNQTYKLYLPNIEKVLAGKKTDPVKTYKPGLFGNLFIKNVSLKKDGTAIMPMKTFKFFEPGHKDNLDKEEVFQQFENYHLDFLKFIQMSKSLNINKIKVTSALGAILKFRLGVCFLFLLNHEIRHLAQGKRAMNNS